MTNTNDARDREQAALEQRLNALRSELRESIRKARSRRTTMTVVMIVAVVVVVGYMSFIYSRLAKIDARFVADVAYGKLQPYIDETPQALGKQLKDYAPQAIDYAEREVLQSPAAGAAYVRDALMAKTGVILDGAEPRITKAVSDAIAQAKASSQAPAPDGKNQAQVDKLIDQMVQQVTSDSQKTIDDVYRGYSQEGDDIIHDLDTLAAGKQLDPLQEHHREIMISFLTLTQKWKTSPPDLGLTTATPVSAPGAGAGIESDRGPQARKAHATHGPVVLPAANDNPAAPVSMAPAAAPAAPVAVAR